MTEFLLEAKEGIAEDFAYIAQHPEDTDFLLDVIAGFAIVFGIIFFILYFAILKNHGITTWAFMHPEKDFIRVANQPMARNGFFKTTQLYWEEKERTIAEFNKNTELPLEFNFVVGNTSSWNDGEDTADHLIVSNHSEHHNANEIRFYDNKYDFIIVCNADILKLALKDNGEVTDFEKFTAKEGYNQMFNAYYVENIFQFIKYLANVGCSYMIEKKTESKFAKFDSLNN